MSNWGQKPDGMTWQEFFQRGTSPCETCGGKGYTRMSWRLMWREGAILPSLVRWAHPCAVCGGSGRVREGSGASDNG